MVMDDKVDGGDNGRSGIDDGKRYFPLIFLLFTSYFSLSLIFLLLFFSQFQKNDIRIWSSFRIFEESM